MSAQLFEFVKTDVGYGPDTIAATTTLAATEWFSMEDYGKFMAVVTASSMNTTENIRIHLQQAKTSTGLGATALSSALANSTATLTGGRRCAELRITFTSEVIGDLTTGHYFKINDLTFRATSETTANVVASRYFTVDTASTRSLAAPLSLSCAINNATYGIAGLSATATGESNGASSHVCRVTVEDPGAMTIDLSSWYTTDAAAGHMIGAFQQTYVACNSQQMKINDGYKFLRAVFTSSAATDAHTQVLRADAANTPVPATITT